MKKIFMLTFSLVMFCSWLQAKNVTKIGYINIQEVLDTVVADRNLRQTLAKKTDDHLKFAEKIAEEIKRLQDKLDNERENLSEERIQQIKEEIIFKQDELKKYIKDSNKELKEKENQLKYTELKEIYQIIKKIAQSEGYSIILEKTSSIIYADESIDITPLVLKDLEKLKESQEQN